MTKQRGLRQIVPELSLGASPSSTIPTGKLLGRGSCLAQSRASFCYDDGGSVTAFRSHSHSGQTHYTLYRSWALEGDRRSGPENQSDFWYQFTVYPGKVESGSGASPSPGCVF